MQRATSPAQYPALSFRRPPECGRKDLSLAELAELIEQLPQIDWSPAIEAAARAERQRAAAFA